MSRKRRDIPTFTTPIIETHCHLDYLESGTMARALEEARAVGVERVVTIAVSPDNLETVRRISETHDAVWCTQGIHPHEANHWTTQLAAAVRAGAEASPRVVAIGEIGLDYYYDHADRSAQWRAFSEQLELAAELDLPVVIHTRDADDDTRAILAEHLPALRRRGVIHSFTSGLALAEYCLDAGFKLGFNGIATFRNAENVRRVIAVTPVSSLVLETDAPYLTPVPYRGHSNAPCYLPFIAECVAETLGLPVEPLLEHAHRNSMDLFFA